MNNHILFFLTTLISFIFILDSVQTVMKMKIAQKEHVVLGIHFSSILLLLNRAAVSLTLLVIAFCVDKGYQSKNFLLIYFCASIIIAFSHIFILQNSFLYRIYNKIFLIIYKRKIELKPNYTNNSKKIWPMLVIISIMGYIGLLMPSILASKFHDYRAFMMQTGFIINTLAVIIYTYSIEKKIAIATSDCCEETLNKLCEEYQVSRFYSFIISAILILSIYLWF